MPSSRFQSPARIYLTETHLDRLRSYKYRGVDHSILGKVILTRWWNFVAERIPRWMAPNVVTLIGFAFILLNIVLIAIFMPDLEGPAPRWVYFQLAFGLFAYQTMDNVDGKQARKTGTSSPLGQLFDHIIDTLNCPLGGLVQSAAMGLGHSRYSAFLILVACWPMYLSAHEEYHTGVLYLGPINGPVEGVMIAISAILISGFCGPDIWRQTTAQALPGPIAFFLPKSLLLEDLFILFVLAALIVGHAPTCFMHIYESTERNLSAFLDALTELLPLFIFTICAGGWITSPYSVLLAEEHLVGYTFLCAFLFGRMATEVILAHLVKGEFPEKLTRFVPIAIISALVNLPCVGGPLLISPLAERLALYGLVVYYGFIFFWMANDVIKAFCSTLGIQAFTIPHAGERPL